MWENSTDSYLCFRLALLHSVYYFFFLYQSNTSYLCTVFDSISSNIDDVHSINPSANGFDFGDLMSIIRTGFPILVELINLVNSSIISNDLTQMVNFPMRIQNCDSQSPALLDLFLSLFVLQWLSLHWKFWSCCCLSYHWLSINFITGCSISSHSLWLFSYWVGWSLWSLERCSMGGYL